ncbi:hypothetical protein FOZ62_009547, partial [Perkinsus olseni]
AGALVTALLCVSQLGANTAYLIFIASSLKTHFQISMKSSLLGCIAVLSPICCLRSVKLLSLVSLVGIICMAVGLIAAAYWAITAVVDTPEEDATALFSPALNAANWKTYPLFLGIAALSFEGVAATALPIENSMANPAKFPNVLGYAVVLILILNLLFSCVMVVAVSGISDDVPGVITRAMPEGSTISRVVSACLSLELLCTYPGNAIPLFKLLERSTAAGRVFG